MVSILSSGMSSLLDYCLLYAMNTKPTEEGLCGEVVWHDFGVRFLRDSLSNESLMSGKDFAISFRMPDVNGVYSSVRYSFDLSEHQVYMLRSLFKKVSKFRESGLWV